MNIPYLPTTVWRGELVMFTIDVLIIELKARPQCTAATMDERVDGFGGLHGIHFQNGNISHTLAQSLFLQGLSFLLRLCPSNF